MSSLLRVSGLRKAYGDKVVLRDLDLDVGPHDVVCLIGTSGSGKSTLLRCLNLLETTDDGTIEFAGEDITDPRVDARAVRSRMGLVFQAYNLFPHMSVMENVVLGMTRAHGVPRTEAEERATSLLERFGLADRAEDRPDRLSGGEQQRVALVRAFAQRPRALLLDEVTSALDPELVGDVLEVVRELKGEGVTMLLVTHEMSFAREVADRVGYLHDGRIVEIGPPEGVLGSPERPETKQFLRRLLEAGRL